jgi:hypothetical protein
MVAQNETLMLFATEWVLLVGWPLSHLLRRPGKHFVGHWLRTNSVLSDCLTGNGK